MHTPQTWTSFRVRKTSTSRPHSAPADPGPPLLVTYFQLIHETPLLSAAEEKELGLRIQKGDREARDRMVRANLRLVVRVARGFVGRGMDLADLIEEGNLGLLRAVDSFDPSRNTRFSTYSCYWIKQSIRRALANTARPIRIPAHMVTLLARWRRAAVVLQGQLNRPPTTDEVAHSLGLPRRQLVALHRALAACNSSLFPLGRSETGESMPESLMDSAARPPDTILGDAEDQRRVRVLLDTLDQREATVLRMRFGFNREGPRTLEEIGAHLGLTRERVRQLQMNALRNLAWRMRGQDSTGSDQRGYRFSP